MKLKLFHINTLQAPNLIGGAERTVSTVSHSLAARGHTIHVFSTVPRDSVLADVVSENFTGTYVGLKNFYWQFDGQHRSALQKLAWHAQDAWNPAMGRILGAYMDAERPDIVLTHNLQGWSCNAWQQAVQRKIPVVHVIHDQSLLCPQTAMFRNGKPCETQCASCRVLSLTRKSTQNNVTAVVAVSGAMLNRHERFGMFNANQNKTVIYNSWRGAWPAERIPLPIEIHPADGLTLGFMGRIESEKGIDVLCDAWAQLKHRGVKLLIAGTGRPDYIVQLREKYGVPESCFLGMQTPEAFFPRVDLVVVPSRAYEGLGNVAFEAMVFGRPVIVSDQGGLPEIPDAASGSVVAGGDVPALIQAISRYADSVEMLQAQSVAARRRATAFHPDRQADAYESFLVDVLHKSK
ncbi:MAG: glycosyltransferase family 4 protein [Rhizobacter sp.]|nr:glycosyltransferase family 4 protein [Burkholderiales bacterium]